MIRPNNFSDVIKFYPVTFTFPNFHTFQMSAYSIYTILVCGSRHYDDAEVIASILGSFRRTCKDGVVKIIQGGCGGADTIALAYQEQCKLDGETFKADWKKFGKAAGPFRNQKMIDMGRPNIILAFHKNIKSSKGTLDMLRRGQENDIPTYLIPGAANSIKKFEAADLE